MALTGEQWDSDLGFYYLRARYSNPQTGRFWTFDSYEGNTSDPLTLHKYLYCRQNPVNRIDPSGRNDINVTGLLTGMTLRSYMTGVAGSYVISKYVGIAFQWGMYGELSQVEIDLYEHWDLFNLIPGAAWAKATATFAKHLHSLGVGIRQMKAITAARRAVPKGSNGFRECEVVSSAVAKELGEGAAARPIALGPVNHWYTVFQDAVYDLSAGQYAKRLADFAPDAVKKYAMEIGTGVWDPVVHREFLELVEQAFLAGN